MHETGDKLDALHGIITSPMVCSRIGLSCRGAETDRRARFLFSPCSRNVGKKLGVQHITVRVVRYTVIETRVPSPKSRDKMQRDSLEQ